jgi:hypothetical protein
MPTSSTDAPARLRPAVASGVAHSPAGFKPALRRARAALQWRLLLWWALLLLLPTLAATLPVWQLLGASLDYSPFAARLAERLDLLAVADIATAVREHHAGALRGGAAVALVLTLLLSPLLSGMTAFAARAPRPPRFGELLAGGAHDYGRMLRMLAWAAVPLALVAVLAGAASGAAGKAAQAAIEQADAERAGSMALLATVVLAALVHVTLEAGRALLATEERSGERRRSAVLAWGAACRLLARRPLAFCGLYLAITLPGLLLAALLGLARAHLPVAGNAGLWAGFALTQLIVMTLGWMRAARLFAFMALVRAN